ncbi:MAG: SusD/RagB family nutrient-binding outer membrane lipoprotein, partial [Flavobacteriaceae bacterium]
MKKYFYTIFLLVLASCSSDEAYEGLNKNLNAPAEVSDNQLFVSAINSLTDFIESTNVNENNFRLYAQYWTQTQYTDEANYDMQNREIPDYMFSEFYRDVLGDLQNAKKQTSNTIKVAQIELLSVYAWQMLVDAFGDVPYTESLNAEGESPVLAPKYDDAKEIYTDLIDRTKTALSGLSGSGSGYTSDDLIFSGSMSGWKKFGSSLLVKLGSRLFDQNNTVAKELIEGNYSNAILANTDNAFIKFEGSPPNTNPLWEDLVQSGRQDFIPADTFVDVMNDLTDPRADKFFDPTSKIDGAYLGGPYGTATPFNDNSHISQTLYAPDFRGVLFDYAEMSFILSEAARRGFSVGGSAEEHY